MRRTTFCDEQGLFAGTDEDEWDLVAYPIVAIARRGGQEATAGGVRIYEVEPGIWYGGRLCVDQAYRSHAGVGRGLVRKAVSLAHGWGCARFLALVQDANVAFFEALRWRALEPRQHYGQGHWLMEADLAHYPPSADPRPAREPAREAAD